MSIERLRTWGLDVAVTLVIALAAGDVVNGDHQRLVEAECYVKMELGGLETADLLVRTIAETTRWSASMRVGEAKHRERRVRWVLMAAA